MELVTRRNIVAVGEGMLELRRAGQDWDLGFGGDTLNTALHLARFGLATAYLTALGIDPFSDELRTAWMREGLDCSLVQSHPSKSPGLYAVRTDSNGERSFTYWRSDSAARRMFDLPTSEHVLDAAADADVLIYSLISLAILSRESRGRLLKLAAEVRSKGSTVVFDGNYRPALWTSAAEAREARDDAIACCTIGLPTFSDEQAISGEQAASEVEAHWKSLGAQEVVVKLGADGCLADGRVVPTPERKVPVDTSGAGDAFNAGYLAARLNDLPIKEACLSGHRLAAWVIDRTGAVPSRDHAAPYDRSLGAQH